MQGCEYLLRQCRGTVSATAMILLACSWASAQPVPETATSVVEHVPVGDAPAGEVLYSTGAGGANLVGPPSDSYSPYGMNYSPSLGMHLRARYNTRSYGQVRGNFDLGTMKIIDAPNGVWFLDGQVTMNDESKIGYNAGIGYRFMTLPLLPMSDDKEKIAGISLWSDGSSTINENFISQVGVSLEYLGDNWDVRWNSYLPTSSTETGDFVATDNLTFAGDFLVQETIAGTDEALDVTELEIARRLGNRDAWLFGGTYGLFGDTVDTRGLKAGLRGYITPDVAVQFAVNDDDEFGTTSVFSATWFIGRTRDSSYCSPSLYHRMREPVVRNDYVAIRQGSVSGGAAVEGDVNGDGINELIQVVHIDSTAAAGGDGSFENPLDTLAGINAASSTNSIVLVHGGSSFTNDSAVLQDGQRMLGEGGNIEHMVSTTNFGDVLIPETAAGAQAGAIPTVNNAGGDAVTLAAGTLEVSNLSIDGGARGVVSPNGSLGVNLNNLTMANTTGNGIELTPGSETVNSVLGVRFQPMITDVTFTNIGGDDINIDGTSPEAASVPVTESIVISNVTSTFNDGVGINLSNNNSAVSIANYTNDLGSNAAGGGVLLTGNNAAVTITDSTISNQAGFGASVVNSDVNHTFNGLDITDTAGAAMHVNGGTGNVSYTGKITQGGAGAALLVQGGHSGSLDFFEGTADAGVIDAQFGDGLVFNDADGTYTFLDGVTVAGTDMAIDVTNDSAGTLTFLDATITDPNGTAIHFNGGSASMSLTGKVTQSNAFDTLLVEGAHTGTLTFNELVADSGVIDATNGNGLVFNDADGGYIFNHAVMLDGTGNGADTAIDLSNDSDGTFTFADGTVVSPTGAAVTVAGGSSVFTFTGEISQNNNVAAVAVSGGHDGSMTFLSPDATTNVVTATNGTGLQFNDADGNYGFTGTVSLDGSSVAADTGIDILNDSAGTFTFSDTTITDPTGTAFNVAGGSADVTFTGEITQSNNATTVAVSGGHTGTLTFLSPDATTNVATATNGNGLQFNDADGNYAFVGTVSLDGSSVAADTGIDILNDSAGTFTFSDTTVTDPTGTAFNIVGGSADVNFTGKINQSNNATAVSVTGGHSGTMTFAEGTNGAGAVEATNGNGLQFNNADGTYTFSDAVVLNGGDAGVDILNGSSGSFNFDNDSVITNPTGDAFVINGSNANVNYDGTITDNTGQAVRIESNSGGTVTFDGEVTSTATGILVQNNTGGSFSFGGGADLDTGTNDAVTLSNNTGTTISFSSLDIDTTTGDGFVATNSDGVQALGLGNSITTTTGTALNMNNVEVSGAGMTFDSVSVNGAVNGVVMNDVTGGPVNIGVGASSVGDGGTIQNTTGDSVVLTNAQDVTLNFVEVLNSGGDGIATTNSNANESNIRVSNSVVRNSTGQGVNLDANGAGVVRLALNDNTLDTNGAESIFLDINGSASTAHLTIDGNNVDNSLTTSEAFSLVGSGATGKTVNLLMQNNDFTNDDATASAANLLANGNVSLNATVLNNTFVNSDATPGPSFQATAGNASASVRLNLNGNTATSGAVPADDDYELIQTAGSFTVEDLADVATNNTGEINQAGVIGNDVGNIPQPQQP